MSIPIIDSNGLSRLGSYSFLSLFMDFLRPLKIILINTFGFAGSPGNLLFKPWNSSPCNKQLGVGYRRAFWMSLSLPGMFDDGQGLGVVLLCLPLPGLLVFGRLPESLAESIRFSGFRIVGEELECDVGRENW